MAGDKLRMIKNNMQPNIAWNAKTEQTLYYLWNSNCLNILRWESGRQLDLQLDSRVLDL